MACVLEFHSAHRLNKHVTAAFFFYVPNGIQGHVWCFCCKCSLTEMTMITKFRKVIFPLLKLVEWIKSSRKLKHIMVTDCKALHTVLMQSNWRLDLSNNEAARVMVFSFLSDVVYSTTKIKVISWLITSIVLSRKEHSFSLYDNKNQNHHAVQNQKM